MILVVRVTNLAPRRFADECKSPISLTDQQDVFARSLGSSGQYEADAAQSKALGELLERRLKEPVVNTAEMGSRIDALIERKRLSLSYQ